MALHPINANHAAQIQAGTLGRKAGHAFEEKISEEINRLLYPLTITNTPMQHVSKGDPALTLLKYICCDLKVSTIKEAVCLSTGTLATSEGGRTWLNVNGINISRCKSDIILTLRSDAGSPVTVGISTKQCSNRKPTNAQLYFTTARGFASLLSKNGIDISQSAIAGLRQFCGENGFMPSDDSGIVDRRTDPRRFFWEEIDADARAEWERLFSEYQDDITRLMLQKAYLDDPFIPTYLLHKTRASAGWNETETAIYSIDELVHLSRQYGSFRTRGYSVRKGSHRDPAGVEHLAPRFGIVQMQRGGQAQHPDQLQFNLEAGYFYKLANNRFNM